MPHDFPKLNLLAYAILENGELVGRVIVSPLENPYLAVRVYLSGQRAHGRVNTLTESVNTIISSLIKSVLWEVDKIDYSEIAGSGWMHKLETLGYTVDSFYR